MDRMTRAKLFAKHDLQRAIDDLKARVSQALPDGSFAEREALVLALLDEVGRAVLEDELADISASFEDRLLIDGIEYKKHEDGTVQYYCLGGVLEVERATYRPVGVRNGPTAVPLELVAGLVEGATPALAYNVAHGYGAHDMRTHGKSLELAHRVPPRRATLERMAKRIASAVVTAVPRIEPLVRRSERLPDGAHAIVMGLDRTSAPMAEERPADAPPKPAPKRRKPRVRRPPKPIDVNFRMAYVGTVSIVDDNGDALLVRRYAMPACDDPATLVDRMIADVRQARLLDPDVNVGVVQDGAPELWSLTRTALEKLRDEGIVERWEEGIDRFHLVERLAAALEITEGNPVDRKVMLDEWIDLMDTMDSAIDSIDRYLTRRYCDLPKAKQAQLWEHLVYLTNNKDRMRYVTLAVDGLPIGSGVTESAAKTVVGQRAKKSGQRWSENGLRGALTLRALDQGDRLPAFWSRFSRRYVANVEAA